MIYFQSNNVQTSKESLWYKSDPASRYTIVPGLAVGDQWLDGNSTLVDFYIQFFGIQLQQWAYKPLKYS